VLRGGTQVSPKRKVQKRHQKGAGCPDLLEGAGETGTSPQPPQICASPRGLKQPVEFTERGEAGKI